MWGMIDGCVLSVCSFFYYTWYLRPHRSHQSPCRNSVELKWLVRTHPSTCSFVVQRMWMLPTLCCFCVPSLPLHLLRVYSNDLTEMRVAGSSCLWDVPVIQCCLLFFFHCQLLSALTSMNSQPFPLWLRNNSAPTTWSLSCVLLQCWQLSNYIACDITLQFCTYELLLLWHLPGHK